MAQEVKYGVISDVHEDPKIVPTAIKILKKIGIEKLLVNGDIGNRQKTLQDSQNYIAFILDSIGKSGLEAFVQPGSHETLLSYGPIIGYFSGKYPNIVDTIKNPKVEQRGHQLVFLPGSDFLCGGEYQIGNHEKIPSGRYIQTEKGLVQFEEFEQYFKALKKGITNSAMQYSNMNDLRTLVSDPDKTIVVCHVPRKFDNVETCVDVAEFGEVIEDFYLNREKIKKGSIFPLPITQKIIQIGAPIKIKRENRGNKDLQALYEELGILKAVSGHFHESGHRANDKDGNHVSEGKLVTELFWNSGHLDIGQTGIFTVGDGKVSYRNIQLQDYLK